MNHDAPMTPAAMQAHIARAGAAAQAFGRRVVSQLAQRCLELEQQLLACQTELAKHSAEAENITLTCRSCSTTPAAAFRPGNA